MEVVGSRQKEGGDLFFMSRGSRRKGNRKESGLEAILPFYPPLALEQTFSYT